MIAALITAIIVIVVAGIALFLFFRSRSVKPGSSVSRSVSSIGTQAPLQTRKAEAVATSTSAHANANGPLRERLKSRFFAVYVLIAAVFGSLATKLWTMQVISSDQYLQASDENQLATIKTPAPRGRIFDTQGIVLVDNKTTSAVLADAEVADDRNVLMRLSALLGLPYAVVRQRIKDSSAGSQAQREVSTDPRSRDVAFIVEHPDAFPGVSIQERTHRVYPYRALAGQVLGYTGTVSDTDLENVPDGADYQSGDEIGKGGVELAYESVLSGAHGERVVVTDVNGKVHEIRSETPASQGNDVHLTISARVQRLAEERLTTFIAPTGVIGLGKGVSGALVAMEVDTGDVIAMASFPTFDPSNFVGGIMQDDWDRYNSDESHAPLVNRCISGRYPAASTFKAFTGMAGLHYGFADTARAWNCTGTWTGFGEDYPQKCWQTSGHGYISFRSGIVVSCDTVFYEIAKDFYYASNLPEDAMQQYIMQFGLGSKTGIELVGEDAGVIPTPAWKREAYRNAPEEAQWRPGDVSNMVIGQGNVLVTPLQMAVAYAGIATGKLPVPNLLKEVRNSAGEVVVTHSPQFREIGEVEDTELEIMRDALRGVATEDAGIPAMLAAYDYQCACKTGTGEKADHDGYSWFAMYAPYDAPKYVITCVIEEGGAGATGAAPIAAEVMDACIKLGNGALDIEVTPTQEVTESVEYIGTGDGRVE